MVWPTGSQVTRDNLNAGSDNPSLARVDLYTALGYLNDIIASENTALGAVVTDAFNKISSDQIPNNVLITNNLSLEPSTKWVSVKNVLNLVPLTTAQLNALANTWQLGDIAVISDADSGNPAICFYDGTNWKKMPFSSLSTL